MNAHLETTFKRGFLLTEESLIKLDDIVQKRLKSVDSAAVLKFKVYRVDGMLLEFDSPSGVIAQENSQRNAITKMELSSEANAYTLRLVFDPKRNTDLEIVSNDRDLAYLLFSDVKDYLNSEVLKFRSFSFDSALASRNVLPFLFLPFIAIPLFLINDAPSAEVVSELIKSSNIDGKLNFLIENSVRKTSGPPSTKIVFFLMIAALVVIFFLGTVLDRVFPRNIFYWGKASLGHDRLVKNREKVVWGVVIAFVIGIASTIAVDFFKEAAAGRAPVVGEAVKRE